MKIKLLIWTTSKAASDGSMISDYVWQEYLGSPRFDTAIDDGSMLCSLTHRSRSLDSLQEGQGKLKGVVGKDDGLLIVNSNNPAPIMKLTSVYMDGDKVYAEAEVFNENLFDHTMSEQIKRFKGLLRSGVRLGCSCVLVCYWENEGGHDVGKKIQALKAVDITVNPSCKDSKVLGIIEDDDFSEITFSEKDYNKMESGQTVCKMFSDTSKIPGISDLPKTSKVGLRFTTLKVKQFSNIITDAVVTEEDSLKTAKVSEKDFSLATVKDRLRMGKLSPRMQFRRLVLDYKQAIKSAGGIEKMKEEDISILKSLFANDVLMLMKQIYPDIMKGKQIATLLGASSISKGTREAAQRLQLPFKVAMLQQEKQGYMTKDRYQKIQDAYADFVKAMIDEVFSPGMQITKEEEAAANSTEEPEI